jgi:hypothetical protein
VKVASGAFVLAALSLAACTDDRDVVEVGTAYRDRDVQEVEAPASVRPGAAFAVRVVTAGGGCITEDRTDVELTADGAVVTPYDRRHIPGENEGCILLLAPIYHVASLALSTPGDATVHVRLRASADGVTPVVITDIPISIIVE